MTELYWGGKRVLGVKPPGEDYIAFESGNLLYGCRYIIPEGTTELPASLCSGWRSLVSVVIPSTVNSIGGSCFTSVPKLKAIYFEGNPPETFGASWADAYVTIYYKSGNTAWESLAGSSTLGGVQVNWATY